MAVPETVVLPDVAAAPADRGRRRATPKGAA